MKRLINRKTIIAFLLLIIFIVILIDIKVNYITSLDDFGFDLFVENLRSENTTNIMKVITTCGSATVLISLILIIFIFIKNKNDGLFGMINIGIAYLINDLIKFIVARPRPVGYNLINENNYSFPSGHAMVSCAVYGYLIYLVYKNIKNKELKYTLIGLLSLLIGLIAVSRVYLGVHYLSDVVGGILLATSYVLIYITIIKGDKGEKSKKKN